MNTTALVLVALVALLIGVSIPVLMQLRATLREMERRMQGLGNRLESILQDSQVVANRVARVSSGLEGGEDSIRDLMEATAHLSKAMTRASGWMGLGTSLSSVVGPVLLAAVQAYRATSPAEHDDVDDSDEKRGVSPSQREDGLHAVQGPGRSDEPFFRSLVDAENNNRREQQRGAGHER